MRGCHSPGFGRIAAPGKVSGSRRFYVINPGYRLERWSGGDGDRLCPTATFDCGAGKVSMGWISAIPDLPGLKRPRFRSRPSHTAARMAGGGGCGHSSGNPALRRPAKYVVSNKTRIFGTPQ